MSKTVYQYEHEGVFTLKITGRNDGRYEAYCERIGVAVGSEESKVKEITPAGFAKVKPAFYESLYFVRCDFHDKSIRDAFVRHRMASVNEEGSAALRSFLQVVLARKNASEYLGSVIQTQGTHVEIGEGFTESDLFDIELAEETSWRELFRFSTNRFQVARASVVDEGKNPEELHFFRVKYRAEAVLILRVEYDAALSTDEVFVYGIQSKEFYR